MSEGENSKGMENIEKSANSDGRMALTSVADVMKKGSKATLWRENYWCWGRQIANESTKK